MSETLRAFVAVELPPEVKDTLSHVVRFLDGRRIGGLRTVDPATAHLTLKFLGNVPASQVAAIEDALVDAASRSTPLRLRLDGTGTFPGRGAPRVLWMGLAGDTEGLAALRSRIEEALHPLGFASEGRPFHPHLTLARLGDRSTRADRDRAAEALSSAPFEPGLTFAVEAVSLMRSILRREGARHVRLASIPLGDSAAAKT